MSFDSVLIVSFGGPQGMADIRPFLANVLRGQDHWLFTSVVERNPGLVQAARHDQPPQRG